MTDTKKLLDDLEAIGGHDRRTFRAEKARLRAAIESLAAKDAEIERLQLTNDRLRQERLDYSSVTTTEGMNASEWIWRTGKAERERDAATARADELAANCNDLRHTLMEVRQRMVDDFDDWATRRIDVAIQFVPAASLAAHDRKVLEEAWERVEEGGICLSNAARLRFKAAILGPAASEKGSE